MKRYFTTAAGLIAAASLICAPTHCQAVSRIPGPETTNGAARPSPIAVRPPSSARTPDGIAPLPSLDDSPTDHSIERLPAVSAIRRKQIGKIERLFPKDGELPPAQSLRYPKCQATSSPPLVPPEFQPCQTVDRGPPPVDDSPDYTAGRSASKSQPDTPPRHSSPNLMMGAQKPLAEPLLPASRDDFSRASTTDEGEEILRRNVLVNPLSGKFDFTEPMSASVHDDVAMEELDPHPSNRISLPPSLAARVDTILSDATRLADRGALFAAKREFLRALRMITRALDTSAGRQFHTQALANGLRALEEADDFSLQPTDSVESDLRLANYIKGHRTPILQHEDLSSLTPLIALQRYYEYAREQLTIAGGGNPLASKAIFAMGRAEMIQQSESSKSLLGAPKALALFHAALTIDPHNAPAANELGVLLAGRGRLPEAAILFERSVASSATPAAVENLATVYEQLGDPRGARWRQQAQQLALQTYGTPQLSAQPVVWLDPHKFAGADAEATVAWTRTTSAADAPSGNIQAAASALPTPAVVPIGVEAGNVRFDPGPGNTGVAGGQNGRRWW